MSARGADPFGLGDEPDLEDLLRVLAQAVKLGIRTHLPASVVSYNPATQTAIVVVGFRTVVRLHSLDALPPGATPSGSPPNLKATLAPTQLTDVPVIFPGTATAYLTFPILTGATGTLHVHDRSLATWLLSGVPSDPVLAWTHALESSEFHPGLHPTTQPIAPATDLTATVVEGPLVKLGRAATIPIAKATPLIAALDAFANATPVSMDGGAAIHTAFKTAWTTNGPLVAATKGQVE
jgi:hypothetical protein